MKKLLLLILFLSFTLPTYASQQVITGGELTLDATKFYPIQGLAGEGIEDRFLLYSSTAGTMGALRVEVTNAPGAGNSWTFTVNNNTSPTACACTISDSATSCNDTDTFAVVATDKISLDPSSTGTPTATGAQWSVIFNGTTSAESIYGNTTQATDLSATATQYVAFAGAGVPTTTEFNAETLAPTSGTIKNLYVRLGTAPGAGSTRVFTLQEDNSPQTLTCTVSGTNKTCTDVSNSFTIATGNSFCLMSVPDAGTAPVAGVAQFGVTFVADTNGEFMFLGTTAANAFSNASIEYMPISASSANPSTTEANHQTLVNACSITTINAELAGTPGTGNSYAFDLHQNTGHTADIACTITNGAGTTCSDTGNTALSADDNMDTEITPDSTPTARTGRVSYTGYIAPTVTGRRMFLISEEKDEEDTINKFNDFAFCESCLSRGSLRNP